MNKAILLQRQQEELKTTQNLEMEHKSNHAHENMSFEEDEKQEQVSEPCEAVGKLTSRNSLTISKH